MLPGFFNSNYTTIHEGFKLMDEMEEFTVDELDKLSNDTDITKAVTKTTPSKKKVPEITPSKAQDKQAVQAEQAEVIAEESNDTTAEFIKKYVDNETTTTTPETTSPKTTKVEPTKQASGKEGFVTVSSILEYGHVRTLLFVFIVMSLSYILNMHELKAITRKFTKNDTLACLVNTGIFGILVYMLAIMFM